MPFGYNVPLVTKAGLKTYAKASAAPVFLADLAKDILDPRTDVLGGVSSPVHYDGGATGVLGASTTSGTSTSNRPSNPQQQQQQQQPSGPVSTGSVNAGGSGGGAAAADDTSYQLAGLDAQERLLRDFLGRAGGKLDQGITQIGDDFNYLTGRAKEQFGRATQDYNTKEADTNMSKEQALGRVDTQARTLANSLRQRVGRASGSGSSAFQLTAPGAVAREASLDRSDVQSNFGTNFRDLMTARQRTQDDYNNTLEDYGRQKTQKEKGLREGFNDQIGQANGSLGDLARQRAALQGGGVSAIRNAGAPYDAEVSRRQQAIDSLFNQFRTPYQAKDVNTQAVNLRDYVTNGAQVTQAQQQAGQSGSPYAKFLQPQDDDELLF